VHREVGLIYAEISGRIKSSDQKKADEFGMKFLKICNELRTHLTKLESEKGPKLEGVTRFAHLLGVTINAADLVVEMGSSRRNPAEAKEWIKIAQYHATKDEDKKLAEALAKKFP
jgi:hypothetical protein